MSKFESNPEIVRPLVIPPSFSSHKWQWQRFDRWMDEAADADGVLTPPTTLTPTSQFTLADGDQQQPRHLYAHFHFGRPDIVF